jgi:iron complex transport system ATP-binding protein
MTAAALTVESLSWGLPRSEPLLRPTSFELAAGQMLAIVGANGAGKSTLLRLLYRFLRPNTGRILLDGQDIWAMSARQTARSIAAVLQEQQSDFSLTVREIIALGRTPYTSGFGGQSKADTQIIDAVIERLKLTALTGRMLGTLSGGERQRTMIARALVQEPQLLILDEPTNHLDIRHQLEVLRLIRGLGPTIVTSLHDLNMAAEYADTLLMLAGGHTMAYGPANKVLTAPLIKQGFGVQAEIQSLHPSGHTRLTFHL